MSQSGQPPAPQVVMLQTEFSGPDPYQTTCRFCKNLVMTEAHSEVGTLTWILCGVIFFTCCPYFYVPFLLDMTKDVHHVCPRCGGLLSIYKRCC